ncbi:glycosyltransferase family 4 protein [bacterium]|nr:glycosyltransferase family 4 protein [bacterium]
MSLFQIDSGKEWRGGQRQSYFLAKELIREGYDLLFVVQPESPLHEKSSQAHLPVFPLNISHEFDVFSVLRLAFLMRGKNCQLVHFHDAHSVAVGSAAASLAKVPLRINSRRVDFPLNKNFFSRFKYGENNLDVTLAVSEGVKDVLIRGGMDPQRVEVIPDGIDFTPFEEVSSSHYLHREFSFSQNDYLVGIVAHLADHKGHKYLIKATEILKEKVPRVKVIVVGEGPLKMKLDRQVKETRLEDMVFFLGFREDIPQILASLDLFVLSSYLEGMGSTLLDAMASRLPIVATRVGGIPEVVTHEQTGLLVPPRDPQALASAILRLYQDRSLASRLGKKGYEVVHQKFSAQAMARKIIDLYKRKALQKDIFLSRRNG